MTVKITTVKNMIVKIMTVQIGVTSNGLANAACYKVYHGFTVYTVTKLLISSHAKMIVPMLEHLHNMEN
jgi:hypothetical protein